MRGGERWVEREGGRERNEKSNGMGWRTRCSNGINNRVIA